MMRLEHIYQGYVATCGREIEHPDEETGRTMKERRVEREYVGVSNLASLGTVIDHAANSYQTCFEDSRGSSSRVCVD